MHLLSLCPPSQCILWSKSKLPMQSGTCILENLRPSFSETWRFMENRKKKVKTKEANIHDEKS